MTATNLALVFGSALLKKGKFAKRESRKTRLGIDHYVASVNVVHAMIDNCDILFQVCGSFRHTYFTDLSPVHKQGKFVHASLKVAKGTSKSSSIDILLILTSSHGAFSPGYLIEVSINLKKLFNKG